MFNRPTKVMADNGLVGLLGIYVMRDIGFCRGYKKQPPEKFSDCFEIIRRVASAVYLIYFICRTFTLMLRRVM